MEFRRSMIARLIAVGAVALFTSGSQFSCSSGHIDSGHGPTFTTTLVLKDSAGVETYSFQSGELIIFELRVRNRTARPVTVNLTTPQAPDFFVFHNGDDEPAWYATFGRAFPTVVTPLEFEAAETKVMTGSWNQELPDGTFLPRGGYEARGAVRGVGVLPTFRAEHELASTLRAFSVE